MAAVILSRATKTQGRNLSPPTNRNPAAVYLASLQPTGRRAMAERLRPWPFDNHPYTRGSDTLRILATSFPDTS